MAERAAISPRCSHLSACVLNLIVVSCESVLLEPDPGIGPSPDLAPGWTMSFLEEFSGMGGTCSACFAGGGVTNRFRSSGSAQKTDVKRRNAVAMKRSKVNHVN